MTVAPREKRPLTELFTDLAHEAAILVRMEFELAKAELAETAGKATSGAASMAVGGALAYAGLLFLMLAATFGLGRVVAMWLAALIVGAVAALVGLILLMVGRRRLSARNLQPRRTIDSLRNQKEWAQTQLGR